MVDGDGVVHHVEIFADRVMLAAAEGFVALAREPWSEEARGELVVEVHTQHTVSIAALREWLGKPGRSPQDVSLRQDVERVLEGRQGRAARRAAR